MKKLNITFILILASTLLFAQKEIPLNTWLKTGPVQVHKPAFASKKDINGKTFSDADLIKQVNAEIKKAPEENLTITLIGTDQEWESFTTPEDSIILANSEKQDVVMLSSYLNLDQWGKIDLKISSDALFQVFIDGKLKHTKTSDKLKEEQVSAELHHGKHRIDIKLLSTNNKIKFAAKATYDEDKFKELTLESTTNPTRTLTIDDILSGKSVSSAEISPSGNYILIDYKNVQKESGKSLSYKVLKNMKTGKNEFVFRNEDITHMKWLPESDKISYAVKINDATNLYIYNVKNGTEKTIAEGIDNLSNYRWAPNERKIIFSISDKAEEPGELKRIYGNEDRIPGFRDRSFLKLLDVTSGDWVRLTAGNLSTSIHDFHPGENKFIFSTSYPVYTQLPYSKQNLYEMDLTDFSLDTIWKDKQYSGWVQYSPEGDRLLVQGGPLCFGEVGQNVSEGQIPNNYDGQLYLFNPDTKKAKSLTYNFAPAVSSAKWLNEDEIYIRVNERDYINLYRYEVDDQEFEKINLNVEVLGRIDFAENEPFAVYTGTSISTPEQLFYLDLKEEKSQLVDKPKQLNNVNFGKTKEWNFTNKDGRTIYGRVYYPPNYNEDKEYPVIVYYYGGTSPVSRSFDGRYPKNIWTSNGYIVYVLQPSGATGFGQEFSALHVEGWGKEQTSDIIEGTKKFLEAHPSADEENIGAIGASYGGYTTMYLQTQTDIFKTAVSHAGISSITSYWGEGYWGYSYNAVAAYDSYPWNNKDLYVEHSPLYNADKFSDSNSILLLHGTADTNVPVGESKQFYAALKILDKNAEMVLIKDQNHWVVGHSERIKWHHTIMSWFAKELKGKPQLWKNMYPEKYLK
jgi:dipeptidyl aminopeptidase/acylaminoacyl peptidase